MESLLKKTNHFKTKLLNVFLRFYATNPTNTDKSSDYVSHSDCVMILAGAFLCTNDFVSVNGRRADTGKKINPFRSQ